MNKSIPLNSKVYFNQLINHCTQSESTNKILENAAFKDLLPYYKQYVTHNFKQTYPLTYWWMTKYNDHYNANIKLDIEAYIDQ